MKENSIDCKLNEDILTFKDIKKEIITSQKNKNELKLISGYDISDKNKSRVCDYVKCNFKCNGKINWETINIDDKTFNKEIIYYDIHITQKYIMSYFKNNNVGVLNDLKKKIKVKDEKILYFALNNLVKNKILFKNDNNRSGYIIYKSDKYVFQPDDISDEKITINERSQKRQQRNKNINITNINTVNNKFLIKDRLCNVKEEIDDNLDLNSILESKYIDILYKIKFNQKKESSILEKYEKYEDYIWDIIIDNMRKKELLQLYKNIIEKKLNSETQTKIIKSLNKSYLVIFNKNKEVISLYNYYEDVFMCLNQNKTKIIKCSPISNSKYIDILNSKIDKEKNKKNKSGGYYSIRKNETIYKIKDLDKLGSGNKVTGTACIGTSTITNKKLIKFINKYNKNILEKNLYYSNNSLCIIYQILLRDLNDKDNIYFLRPGLYNYLSN